MKQNRVDRIVPSPVSALILSLFLLPLGMTGCTSVEVAGPTVHVIELKEAHTVSKSIGKIQLPAGVYQPDFTTKKGVYYRAPTHMTTSAMGIHSVMRGGLYLPGAADSDKRQGYWFDQQEGATVLSFGMTSPKTTYRFTEKIPFIEMTNQPDSGTGVSK